MKITYVRVGKLVSGPGFSNRSIEVEASVDEGESAISVRQELELWCEAQLQGKTIDSLRSEKADLEWCVAQLGRQKTALQVDCEGLKAETNRLGGLQAVLAKIEQDTGQIDIEHAP